MSTSKPTHCKPAFAVWLTGLPGSGKSTITASLVEQLSARGVDAAVLESDVLRIILTPQAEYSEVDRQNFYRAMVYIGKLLTDHGVPVIFDATANRRAYREPARAQIKDFLEVHVDCPLSVCIERDPKGLYRRGQEGDLQHLPGLQSEYEPPVQPELVITSSQELPSEAARRIVAELSRRGYLRLSQASADRSDQS